MWWGKGHWLDKLLSLIWSSSSYDSGTVWHNSRWCRACQEEILWTKALFAWWDWMDTFSNLWETMDACAFPSKLAPFLGPTVRKYVGSTAMTRCHFLFSSTFCYCEDNPCNIRSWSMIMIHLVYLSTWELCHSGVLLILQCGCQPATSRGHKFPFRLIW